VNAALAADVVEIGPTHTTGPDSDWGPRISQKLRLKGRGVDHSRGVHGCDNANPKDQGRGDCIRRPALSGN
jgi:hypothetical protein